MLAKNSAETLRFRCERQVAVELVRKADAGHTPLAKPLRKLLTEWIGQNGRVEEDKFNWSVLLNCAGEVPDTFDYVAPCAGSHLGKSAGNGGLKNEDRERG